MTPETRPNLFLVGAPKAGTTAFTAWIAGHPDIFVARKELHYFGSDIRRNIHDRAEYLSHFAAGSQCRVRCDASVWYLVSECAAAEIRQFDPEARIVILLRDPVAAAYSNYFQMVDRGHEDQPSFEAALSLEAERTAGRSIPPRAYRIEGLLYRHTYEYAEQVSRYLDAFGDRVFVALHNELVNAPLELSHRFQEFLGLDVVDLGAVPRLNEARSIRSVALQRLLRRPPHVVRRMARTLFGWLPGGLASRVHFHLLRLNTRQGHRPPLAADTRARLRDHFVPDVQATARLIGRDLSLWL